MAALAATAAWLTRARAEPACAAWFSRASAEFWALAKLLLLVPADEDVEEAVQIMQGENIEMTKNAQ